MADFEMLILAIIAATAITALYRMGSPHEDEDND